MLPISCLPVQERQAEHGCAIPSTCMRCGWHRETVLHAFVQSEEIRELIAYIEQLLSTTERVQISIESIIKTMSPSSLNRERRTFFLCAVAMLKETVCVCVKRITFGTFTSGWGLVGYFNYHLKSKVWLGKRYLSYCTFDIMMNVVRKLRMNGNG